MKGTNGCSIFGLIDAYAELARHQTLLDECAQVPRFPSKQLAERLKLNGTVIRDTAPLVGEILGSDSPHCEKLQNVADSLERIGSTFERAARDGRALDASWQGSLSRHVQVMRHAILAVLDKSPLLSAGQITG